MAGIVVVEDEVDINNLIKAHLEGEGHSVTQAFDGPSALALVEEGDPRLVILDWMLPGLDGLSVCRRIRKDHLVPIIMLTARGEEIDRVLGLEVGADDYVVKPFTIRELLARVRSTLRRVELDTLYPPGRDAPSSAGPRANAPPPPMPLVLGPLRVDPARYAAELDGAPLDLTRREFDLLFLLASHPGRVFSRDFLLDQLWGSDYDGFDRTVDTHVTRLRKKLGPLGGEIDAVRGVGYRFLL